MRIQCGTNDMRTRAICHELASCQSELYMYNLSMSTNHNHPFSFLRMPSCSLASLTPVSTLLLLLQPPQFSSAYVGPIPCLFFLLSFRNRSHPMRVFPSTCNDAFCCLLAGLQHIHTYKGRIASSSSSSSFPLALVLAVQMKIDRSIHASPRGRGDNFF